MVAEAKAFWDAISGKIKNLIHKETENDLKVQRYDVTTAPNGTVIGVTQPFGSNEIFLPYSQEVKDAIVGNTVLVAWWGSMSNAKAYFFADGYDGVFVPTRTSELINDSGFVTEDTKVTQTATTTSGYTYWRPLVVGQSAVSAESGAFSTVTDGVRVFDNIRVQPSTGTIKATTFNGNLTGTASGNYSSTNPPPYPVTSVNGQTGAVTVSVPSAYTSTPAKDGTGSAGTSTTWARGNHVHPLNVDTTKPAALGTAATGSASTYARRDHVHALPAITAWPWTLAGSATSSSTNITYPATATELRIVGVSSSSSKAMYSNIFYVSDIAGSTSLTVGGYYISSGDHGICNVTHTPASRRINFRNIYWGSTNGGTIYVYYR